MSVWNDGYCKILSKNVLCFIFLLKFNESINKIRKIKKINVFREKIIVLIYKLWSKFTK